METKFDKLKIKYLIKKNDYDRAAEIVQEFFKYSGKKISIGDAFIVLGNYFAAEKKYEDSGLFTKLFNLKPNTDQAILCFHKALQAGNPNAIRRLEQYYCYNKNGRKNEEAMAYVYGLGAALNDAYSEYKLGKLYFDGLVYERDYEQALKHFKKSFVLNPDYSSFILGSMYEKGLYVKQDKKKAFEYFLEGSKTNLKSKRALARIYSIEASARTHGVKKDLNLAEKYYREYLDGMATKNDKMTELNEQYGGSDNEKQIIKNNAEKMKICKKYLKNIREERREKIKDFIEEAKAESKNQEGKVYDLSFIPQR